MTHAQPVATAAPPPPRPPTAPPPPAKSSSTAHLCAGVYLDEEFRNRVLRGVYHRPHRALAPNPGADAVPIVQHALRARMTIIVRAAVALAILLFGLVIDTTSALMALMLLVFWQLAVAMVRLLIDAARFIRTGDGRPGTIGIRLTLIIAIALCTLVLMMLLGGLTAENSTEGGVFTEDMELSPLVWLGLWALVTIGFELSNIHALKNVPHILEPPIGPDPRLRFLASNTDPQVVNYAADRPPFVGSGTERTTWQFALPLRPKRNPNGGHERPWPHFDTVSLSRHVKEAIAALAHDTSHSRHLPGLQLSDHIFVSGHDTSRPTHAVGELAASGYSIHSIEDAQNDPTMPLRHYLRCQVVSWDGELVTTVYMHTALQGETLYMEFSSYVLPPTKAAYHVFGRDSQSRTAAMVWGAFRSLVHMPMILGRGLTELFATVREGLGRLGRNKAQWSVRGSDDFGAEFGIREAGGDAEEHHYFQYRDVIKYTRILERQLLATVVDYLSDKIDVAELTNRAETIINAGVVNYGNLQAGAIGPGATANVGAIGEGSDGDVQVSEGTI